jgi:peptidoglycan/xylan/chitin deacetylase (PgdA/CDA1 family)
MTANLDVNILMYHSIAKGRGPLAIAPETFRSQLDTLAECGYRAVALRDYATVLDGGHDADRVAVLTFDDGYSDFASVVVPEITARGWSCTVFVSTGLIGAAAGWDPDGHGKRRLIDWPQAMDCSGRGIEIGAHGVTHADLTQLPFDEARREIDDSKRTIEDRIASPVVSFAAPYGHITPALRAHLSQSFQCAVGTSMASATAASDRYDLPRIDMWYFRSQARWRAYLDGARTYFAVRQMARRVRTARFSSGRR